MDFIVEAVYQQCLKIFDNQQRLNLASMLLESVKVECFSLIQEEQLKNDFINIPNKQENKISHNDSFPENISLSQPQEDTLEDEIREAPGYDIDEGKSNYILENLKKEHKENCTTKTENESFYIKNYNFKDVFAKLRDLLIENGWLWQEEQKIDINTKIRDLNIQIELDHLQLIMEVEYEFNCLIEDWEAERIATIGELVELIIKKAQS